MRFKYTKVASIIILASCSVGVSAKSVSSDTTRPNILVIVADDLGYSDIGSFGGEISTPNLDSLAKSSYKLTNFHTSPTCSPTRASLITGADPHTAGLGNMAEELAPNQIGKDGYEGHINNNVETIAEILKSNGYNTYLTGKWHLGTSKESNPQSRGFDKSFALLPGGASHFSDMKPAYSPTPDAKALYTNNGVVLDKLPENFKYSSQFYADKMIEYLKGNQKKHSPFFAMLSFTAPHWPLQAPDSAIKKYKHVYDEGYDVLFKKRLAAQKKLGIIPSDAEGAARPPKGVPWNDLSIDQQKIESKDMEVYAAMIDEMDQYTGKVIKYLKKTGQYENTLIVFMSDNGPEGHDLDETWPKSQFPKIRKVIDQTHDFSYAQIGRPGSYTLLGPNWAWAASPALSLHKGYPTEGGIRTVAMVKPPHVNGKGQLVDNYINVMDIVPTILNVANIPQKDGKKTTAKMLGKNFLPITANMSKTVDDRVVGGELMGKYYVRDGNWKYVVMPAPWGSAKGQLFNLDNDLAEKHDLSKEYPKVLSKMKEYWKEYSFKNKVILPSEVSGY